MCVPLSVAIDTKHMLATQLRSVDSAVRALVGDGDGGGLLGRLGLTNNTLIIFTRSALDADAHATPTPIRIRIAIRIGPHSDNGPSMRWGLSAGSAGIFSGRSAAYANGTAYTNTAKGSTWEGERGRMSVGGCVSRHH